MSVQRSVRGQVVWVQIPTDVHRDLGLFMMFLGLIGAVPAAYILNRLILQQADWDWRVAGGAGLALALFGLLLNVFSRKTFRLTGSEVRIQDGMLTRGRTYRWAAGELPRIRMRSVEEERGGKMVEVFEVHLVEGKHNYLLDRRPGQQMESRTLAEMLAKAIGCPILEKNRETGEILLAAEELDLPFVERVRRHPVLLGPVPDRPGACPVREEARDQDQSFQWSSFNRNLGVELTLAGVFLLGLQTLPLVRSSEGIPLSLLDVARDRGDYTGFLWEFGLLAVWLFLVAGLSHEVELRADAVGWCRRVWGIAYRRAEIPVKELEQISVRESSMGTYLQLISDRRIISLRLLDAATAAWLAARIRHHYANPAAEGVA